MKIVRYLCPLLLIVALSSCTIRIGRGGVGGTETEPVGGSGYGGGGGGVGASGGSGGAAEDPALQMETALANADQNELARVQFRSQAASYAFQGYVDESGVDPATLDAAAAQALIDQYAGPAWDLAGQWLDALDPSGIPQATVKPKYECMDSQGCSASEYCTFEGYGKTYCAVTGCGKGACPTCPDIFDLSALIVKGWCSYTCMQLSTNQIVGIKIILKLQLFGELDKCLALAKPVPCDGGMCL